MPTAQQSAQEILSSFVAAGARPGRSFPAQTNGPLTASFPGAIQQAFLKVYALSDLVAGLAYAVTNGWLSLGNKYFGGDGSAQQLYLLELAGFTEAGGSAPTQASAAQQLINVAAAINNTPMAAAFSLAGLNVSFVGGSFAIEDMIGGYGYAFVQGWIRPCGKDLFETTFALTAAGAAQAT